MALVVPKAVCRAWLDSVVGAEGEMEEVTVRLFKNNVTVDGDTEIADLTVADFTGYAESTVVVWGGAFTNTNGKAEVIGGSKQFTATGSATPNTVYGYYVVDGDSELVYAENFNEPIEVTGVGDAIVVVPRFTLGSQE
jgi:hypothetical protein